LEDVQQAVARTIPTGPRQRRRLLLDLARALKALIPDATPAELRGILQNWHKQALPFIRTKPFSTTWADFVEGWQCVRVASGLSFRAAAHAAEDGDLPEALEHLGYDGDLRRLAALCWQLQGQWGERPFPLGCRKGAEFLGVSKTEANRLLRALAFDGVLQLVRKGTKGSRKASEWRFVVEA
jgi:hypothetical protein